MSHKRHSYQIYNTANKEVRTVLHRKMFILLDQKNKPVVNRDGYIMLFYRSRDAKSFIFKNKGEERWRIKRTESDITVV